MRGSSRRVVFAGLMTVLYAGCGGDGGGPTPVNHAIGGTVSGLRGAGLVLRLNGSSDLPVSANGTFAFSTPLANGASYSVTVQAQPTARPAQTCSVSSGGSGSVTAAASSAVAVSCREWVGRFLYVPNANSDSVSAYLINAATGALTPISGAPYAGTGTNPTSAVTSSDGLFLYVIGANGGNTPATLSGYRIDQASGALSLIAGMPLSIPGRSPLIAVHPGGRFLYVQVGAGSAPGGTYGYSIDSSTGALTALAASPFPAPINNPGRTFNRTGSFFYVGNPATALVESYRIDPSTGALSFSGGRLASPGITSLTLSTSGGHLVVTFSYTLASGTTTNGMTAFSTSTSTGIGTQVNLSPYPTGYIPYEARFSADQSYLYVNNLGAQSGAAAAIPGGISAYRFDAATGVATGLPGSPYATGGSGAQGLVLDPTGRYLVAVNGTTATTQTGSIAAFIIDAVSGALTPLSGSPLLPVIGSSPGAVVFDPSGRFLYLTDRSTNAVSSYAVNPLDDTFSFVGSVPAGIGPGSVPVVAGLQ